MYEQLSLHLSQVDLIRHLKKNKKYYRFFRPFALKYLLKTSVVVTLRAILILRTISVLGMQFSHTFL